VSDDVFDPTDVLEGLDVPRPLPANLRAHLEEQLSNSAAGADFRPLPVAVADRLEAGLVGSPVRTHRRRRRVSGVHSGRGRALIATAAAAVAAAAVVGLAVGPGHHPSVPTPVAAGTVPSSAPQGSALPAATPTAAPPASTTVGSTSPPGTSARSTAGSTSLPAPAAAAAQPPKTTSPPATAAPVTTVPTAGSQAPGTGSGAPAASPTPASPEPGGGAATAAARAPSVQAVTPRQGTAAGGTWVTVTGAGFDGATQVRFGDAPATQFVVDTDGQLRALSPSHAQGQVDIVVVTPSGSSPSTTADSFLFTA
jgi:hypothetical protein